MEILLKTSITAKAGITVWCTPNFVQRARRIRQSGPEYAGSWVWLRDCQANNNADWQAQPHNSFQELNNLCYSTSVVAFKARCFFPKAAKLGSTWASRWIRLCDLLTKQKNIGIWQSTREAKRILFESKQGPNLLLKVCYFRNLIITVTGNIDDLMYFSADIYRRYFIQNFYLSSNNNQTVRFTKGNVSS